MASLRPWILRAWRLLALVLAAWLLHSAAEYQHRPGRTTISLALAQRLFPDAAAVFPPRTENGPDEVFDSNNRHLGFVTKTSPQADSIIGYSGPNDVLVGLSKSGRVIGLELLSSGDTDAHVADVKRDEKFWNQFRGWTPSHETAPKIDGVSGSTLTSLGIAEAIQKRLAGRVDSLRFPEPVTLEEIRTLFPQAKAFESDNPRPGWHRVNDKAGATMGFVVRTSPYSDFTRGHAGPTESLVAVGPDTNDVVAVQVRESYDTEDYIESVREDSGYLQQLTEFDVEDWRGIDLQKSGLEGVSGATETSFSVAEGIRRRFAGETRTASVKTSSKRNDWALFAILFGSLVMTFTELRGKRHVRVVWQAALIGIFGLWCGDLLSLALLVGWARNGLAWQLAPALVLMAALALLVPWGTRRQLYCHQLCPHGAAQEWLGRFRKLHRKVPAATEKYLRFLPAALLVAAFLVGLTLPGVELAALEPFDAWAMRGAVVAAMIIAVAGLVTAMFVPMAYCRYGCPTGALLKFVRATGSGDRFGSRDIAALSALVVGATLVFWPRSTGERSTESPASVLRGTAFGTTWHVKLRDPALDSSALQEKVAAEFERIESSLSHWRTNSATAAFNAARTTHAIEVPTELAQLVARANEISRICGGAFDITVAPLVQAWGFGPNDTQRNPPDDEEIEKLRASTGWQKLRVSTNDNTLQKSHPELQIDLGSILQGYGADRAAELLLASGAREFLINVGGELRAGGRWRVAVENPEKPQEPLRVITLEDNALATSGTYRGNRTHGTRRWSHLIDPSTGKPAQHGTTLVSVLDSSGASADAWATALLVLGEERAEAVTKSQNLKVLIIGKEGPKDINFSTDTKNGTGMLPP